MKVIKYTLTLDGSTPEYVIDGGQFPVKNNNAWPQDLDLVGIATDDAPDFVFNTKTDLLNYLNDNNFVFKRIFAPEVEQTPIPTEDVVDIFWSKL